MRALALAALPATLLVGGCDAFGGAATPEGDEPSTFAVVGRYPKPGRLGVLVNTYVEITFNDVIDSTSVDADAIELNGVAYGSLVINGTRLRFIPWSPLAPGTSYAITVDPQLSSSHGHLLS